jgi:chromate transporter
VFLVFLRLGLTSFGGPIAHLGYFREEFVVRRRWLTEHSYADLVALCQFLPGPASSQVGMALGLARAGHAGALAAWAGFTLPSAALMIAFAFGIAGQRSPLAAGALHGLEVVAVAVVAQAVWGMGRALCTDAWRVAVMVASACAVVFLPASSTQVGVIVGAAVIGMLLLDPAASGSADPLPIAVSRRAAAVWLAVFVLLLLGLPLVLRAVPGEALARAAAFYRTGALVFGGGHVVLPLLQAAVVPPGWIGDESFLAGYGAAQALPGPLFAFAAFLGAAMNGPPNGIAGGLLCLGAIFLPSYLLVAGALPFWEPLRRNRRARAALAGVNAAVVGLLLAALYRPVGLSAIRGGGDLALALTALFALMAWRLPPWLVAAACAAAGALAALPG